MTARTLLLALPAALLAAVPAAADAATPAHMVRGPHGTAILRPAERADRVAFVVRAGRRPVAGAVRMLAVGGSRQYTAAAFQLPPGRTFRVEAAPLRADRVRVVYDIGPRGGRRTRVAFTVRRLAPTAPPSAPTPGAPAPLDAPDTDTQAVATKPAPGAQAGDPSSTATWSAAAGLRRDGRSCVTVMAFTPGSGLRGFPPAFCGHLDQDAFYARTRLLGDGAAQRLVLAGAAAPDRIVSVAVTGPDGTRPLPLSARVQDGEGTEGAFVAVYDPSVAVDALTLTVTLADGTVVTHAAPRAVNLRDAAGNPIN
jgi:hypothetical protein